MIKLTESLPKWLGNKAVLFAAGAGFIAIILCETFIVDAPLLLTLAQSACTLPLLICVIWRSLALSKNSLRRMSILGLLWRLALALQIGGFFALSFASDIFGSIAAELKLHDATAASQAMIQAMHEQAGELTSLALAWTGYSLGFWVLALIVFGVIWIRRSFVEVTAIKESPKLNKDEIFVVGDRG